MVDGHTYFTSEKGIAQGGVLSPLLMNVALHGMESVVGEGEILRFAQNDKSGQNDKGRRNDIKGQIGKISQRGKDQYRKVRLVRVIGIKLDKVAGIDMPWNSQCWYATRMIS